MGKTSVLVAICSVIISWSNWSNVQACSNIGDQCDLDSDCCDFVPGSQEVTCLSARNDCVGSCPLFLSNLESKFSVPLSADTIVDLADQVISCEEGTDKQVVVTGGYALTLRATTETSFEWITFLVEDGSSLIFDIPSVVFAPTRGLEDFPSQAIVEVEGGASVVFKGDVFGNDDGGHSVVFDISGDLTVEGDAKFISNRWSLMNRGNTIFKGETAFERQADINIVNTSDGFLKFIGLAYFKANTFAGDGEGNGGALRNNGVVIFKGQAVFEEHDNNEGSGAIENNGRITFKQKATFTDNGELGAPTGTGGAIWNRPGGFIKFKKKAIFRNNLAAGNNGGAFANIGGEMIFKKKVVFSGNMAQESGGAVSNQEGGVLIFSKPDQVIFDGTNKCCLSDTCCGGLGCDDIFNGPDSEVQGYTGVDGNICGTT